MDLTQAQLQALKTYITSQPDLASQPANSDGDFEIAKALNLAASPSFIVWRNDVRSEEIGNAWVGTDIDGMTAINMQRLQLLLASSPLGVFDMGRVDRRAGFENPFGTNANNASRVAMRAVWKRPATRIERVYATGVGSDASPGNLVVVGPISYQEVGMARAL